MGKTSLLHAVLHSAADWMASQQHKGGRSGRGDDEEEAAEADGADAADTGEARHQ